LRFYSYLMGNGKVFPAESKREGSSFFMGKVYFFINIKFISILYLVYIMSDKQRKSRSRGRPSAIRFATSAERAAMHQGNPIPFHVVGAGGGHPAVVVSGMHMPRVPRAPAAFAPAAHGAVHTGFHFVPPAGRTQYADLAAHHGMAAAMGHHAMGHNAMGHHAMGAPASPRRRTAKRSRTRSRSASRSRSANRNGTGKKGKTSRSPNEL
jgi:hypothetical protein